MRLSTYLESHATRSPDKLALVVDRDQVTYRELARQVADVARGLARLGLEPGDRIALYIPNSVEFVTIAYAAWSLGAVVVPVNTVNTLEELVYYVADSGAAVVAFGVPLGDAVRTRLRHAGDPTLVAVNVAEPGAVDYAAVPHAGDGGALPDVPVEFDEAVIMYTSGTTGRPKGAVLTHGNFISTSMLSTMQWGLSGDDIGLVTTPLAHRTGLARMINSVCLGAKLVVIKRFGVETALQAIERDKVTVIGTVPTVGRLMLPLLKAKPECCASLRHLLVTGEAFPVELKRELAALLPHVRLCSFFAMTEAGSISALTHEEQFTHPTSVGRVIPGIEVKIIDEAGRTVPDETVGEICVRSGTPGRFSTMKHYFGRPKETAEAIVDGWLRTGDLGRFDKQGYLYVVDRKKDMILSGGYNIYTKEVEHTLLQHPDIEDAAIVGIPDDVYGEAVVAFIQLRGDARLSAEAVQEFTKAHIASYKKPKHVFFRKELPRNAVGKVLKAELRAAAAREIASAR